MVTSIPLLVGMTLVSTVIIWAGAILLESSSERLAAYYGLPAAVQGAVIVAIGSSFPELWSVVAATIQHGAFDLGVGAIVGSAIFNVLVIPALASLAGENTVEVNREIVYKEAQFYMLAVAVIIITFALAVIYNPGNGGLVGEINRPLAAIPLLLYGLYVFIQYLDASDYIADEVSGVNVGRQWLALLAGLALIVVGVEILVEAAVGFGEVFDTPSFLWGLTVVAAATSIPDAFVSVRTAKTGSDVTSVANVLGSNTFDLLVAVPVGVLIAGVASVNFAAAVPMFGFLTLATVMLFTFLRTDYELTELESYVLLATYAFFVGWVVAETFGWVNFVPG